MPPAAGAAAQATAAATSPQGGLAFDEAALEAMGLGELRKLARERGVRGDTKAELLQALLSRYVRHVWADCTVLVSCLGETGWLHRNLEAACR